MSRNNQERETTEHQQLASVYGEDLYRPEFIIGYTGDLDHSPTVYFHDPETKRIGSITQSHHMGDNIGRSLILQYENEYSIEGKNEYIDGFNFHRSRSLFKPVTPENLPQLSGVISLHKDIKSIHRVVQKNYAEIASSEGEIAQIGWNPKHKAFLRYERSRIARQQQQESPSINSPNPQDNSEPTTQVEKSDLENLREQFSNGKTDLENLRAVKKVLISDNDQQQLKEVEDLIKSKKSELIAIRERIIALSVKSQIDQINQNSLTELISSKDEISKKLKDYNRSPNPNKIKLEIAKQTNDRLNEIISDKVDQIISEYEHEEQEYELVKDVIESIKIDYALKEFTNSTDNLKRLNESIKKFTNKNIQGIRNIKNTTNALIANIERDRIKLRLSEIRHLVVVKDQFKKYIEIKGFLDQDLSNKSKEELAEVSSKLIEIQQELQKESLLPELKELLVAQHRMVTENVERGIENANKQEEQPVLGSTVPTATTSIMSPSEYIALQISDYCTANDLDVNTIELDTIHNAFEAIQDKNSLQLDALLQGDLSNEQSQELEMRLGVDEMLSERIELAKKVLDKGKQYFSRSQVEAESPIKSISQGIDNLNKIDTIFNSFINLLESSSQKLTTEQEVKCLALDNCQQQLIQKIVDDFKKSNQRDIDVLKIITQIKDPDTQLKLFMKHKNIDQNNPEKFKIAKRFIDIALNSQEALSMDQLLGINRLASHLNNKSFRVPSVQNSNSNVYTSGLSQQSKIDRLLLNIQSKLFGDFKSNQNSNRQRSAQQSSRQHLPRRPNRVS